MMIERHFFLGSKHNARDTDQATVHKTECDDWYTKYRLIATYLWDIYDPCYGEAHLAKFLNLRSPICILSDTIWGNTYDVKLQLIGYTNHYITASWGK